mgnify:CR=1 FL=1
MNHDRLDSFSRYGLARQIGDRAKSGGKDWHFVDIVWILIFTLVYLIPA